MGLTLVYLDKLLLLDTALPVATFKLSSLAEVETSAMVIDAQAIEHLDILPPPTKQQQDQSLFTYLSQGVRTAFGKRMLKRWVVSPLTSAKQVHQRQDAVADLVASVELRNEIQSFLRKLPDVERLMSRVFTYSVKGKVKAFYVD